MNRSLQKYLRCIINGNDTRYTEWSADLKLFPYHTIHKKRQP